MNENEKKAERKISRRAGFKKRIEAEEKADSIVEVVRSAGPIKMKDMLGMASIDPDLPGSLLIIDDEEDILLSLRRQFRRKHNVILFNNAKDAYQFMQQSEVHVIISDQRMPEMTGAEFFEKIKGEFPNAIRLLLTGYADLDAVISAINDGNVFRYIAKPWKAEELEEIVEEAFSRYNFLVHNKRLVQDLNLENNDLRNENKVLLDIKEHLEQLVEERTVELAALKDQFELLSITDRLTDLYNRGQFDHLLTKQLTKSVEKDEPLSLLFLDIDHFKSFNDNFGHLVGDQVLIKLGALLKENVRDEDIAARYGGEEFAIILPRRGNKQAIEIAERLCNLIRVELTAHFAYLFETKPDFVRPMITVSIGSATTNNQLQTERGLIAAADEALYEAKKMGRNRVVSKNELS